MSRLVTKSDALKNALVSLGIGILLQVIGLWQFALIFGAVAVIFWLVYRHYAKRDRRLARRTRTERISTQAVVPPPKASPDSSSLDIDFD